jgi:RNA polymerase sigma-70 factor (ECF subfamily)
VKFFWQRNTRGVPTTGSEGADLSALASPAFVSTVVATRSDVLSFDQVYDTHFDFVWRYARNRGVPLSALDDVVQEVFIIVHRKLATFEGRSSVRTWLAMITRRAARDHLRKRGNAPVGEPLGEHEASHLDGPAEVLDQKMAAGLLDDLLSRMTEIQREAFVLHEVEQMTGAEIAEALGVNENTIHTRLRAARQIFETGVARARSAEMRNRPWPP